MKIGFFNPYFDAPGGGERYTLTLASHWSKHHHVDVFWNNSETIKSLGKRFSIDVSRITVKPDVFSKGRFMQTLPVTRTYDCIFFLSDGSVPTSLARKNIVHFQVPFLRVAANPIARFTTTHVVCNSEFTKTHLDPSIQKDITVIYPPVEPVTGVVKKTQTILSVGRFTSVHEAKKQHVLIDAFIRMEQRFPTWSLILAGGLVETDRTYFKKLEDMTQGHNIKLIPNVSHVDLESLYKKARVYWHAAGFAEQDPQYHEHFGIATVEAASAGAVPVVYAGGGQTEIITHGVNGYLWLTQDELIEQTIQLLGDTREYSEVQRKARDTWKSYSLDVFTKAFDALLV